MDLFLGGCILWNKQTSETAAPVACEPLDAKETDRIQLEDCVQAPLQNNSCSFMESGDLSFSSSTSFLSLAMFCTVPLYRKLGQDFFFFIESHLFFQLPLP
jgi:hypothetical protein